jgi:hypothetical protein
VSTDGRRARIYLHLRSGGTNPLIWAVIGVVVGIGGTLVAAPFLNSVLTAPIFLLVIAVPIASLIAVLVFYPSHERRLSSLVALYLSLILIFSVLHFQLVLFFDEGHIAYDGIHPAWKWLGGTQGRVLELGNVIQSFADCFHFSVVTMTTVGYGDMTPTRWYSRLLSDVQVLVGLGVVVVGVGRYFAGLTSKE